MASASSRLSQSERRTATIGDYRMFLLAEPRSNNVGLAYELDPSSSPGPKVPSAIENDTRRFLNSTDFRAFAT